jgi:hypothetical protein
MLPYFQQRRKFFEMIDTFALFQYGAVHFVKFLASTMATLTIAAAAVQFWHGRPSHATPEKRFVYSITSPTMAAEVGCGHMIENEGC